MKSLTNLPPLRETTLSHRASSQAVSTGRFSLKPMAAYSRGKLEFFLKPDRQPNLSLINDIHKKKLAAKLSDLKELKNTREGCFGPCSQTLYNQLTERIIKKAQEILQLYNIKLDIIETSVLNSKTFLKICPLTKRNELSDILLAITPEICSIPSSLLQKVELGTLTFCDEVIICQRGNSLNRLTNRGSSTVIQVAKSDSPMKIIQDVYRIILKNLLKKLPELKTDWQNFIRKIQGDRTYETKWAEDLTVTLMALIKNKTTKAPIENAVLCLKVSELKNKLRIFDPDGFEDSVGFKEMKLHKNRMALDGFPVL